MHLTSWLRNLGHQLRGLLNQSTRRQKWQRLKVHHLQVSMIGRIQPLESRTLLSIVTWTGSGDSSSWNDAANWSTNDGTTPGATDDVVIPTGFANVVHSSGWDSVN